MCYETLLIKNRQCFLLNLHLERIRAACGAFSVTLPDNLHQVISGAAEIHGDTVLRIDFAKGLAGRLHYSFRYRQIPGPNTKLHLGISGIIKSVDEFSRFKLPFYDSLTTLRNNARHQGFDDILVFNQQLEPCETAIANFFIVENDCVFTPPLESGCVDGVFRKFLLNNLPGMILEENCSMERIAEADEIFLTNAVRGIQPVSTFNNKPFSTAKTMDLKKELSRISGYPFT